MSVNDHGGKPFLNVILSLEAPPGRMNPAPVILALAALGIGQLLALVSDTQQQATLLTTGKPFDPSA